MITGAAGLLGIEHTIALLSAGARVIMTDVDEKKLAKAEKFIVNKIGLKPICYCIGLAVLLRARLPIVMIAKLN